MNSNNTMIENKLTRVEQQRRNGRATEKEISASCHEIMQDIKTHCTTKKDNLGLVTYTPNDAGKVYLKRVCDVYTNNYKV